MTLKARQSLAKSPATASRISTATRAEAQRDEQVKAVLATARQQVQALVKREGAGEVISGDVLTFRLRATN